MIASIARFFGVRLKPHNRTRKRPSIRDLVSMRSALLDCIDDCDSAGLQRLRQKITHAQSPQELWLLRNDAYQLISQRHNQTIAAERINNLMSVFEGWLDPKQLARIR